MIITVFCRIDDALQGLVRRTTFARQAANLWRVKEPVWQMPLDALPHDPTLAMVGRFTVSASIQAGSGHGQLASARDCCYHAETCTPG